MNKDRKVMEFFRTQRKFGAEQQVGNRFSSNGSKLPVPINTINQYCQVYGRSLVAKNPRAMLSTFNRKAKPTVNAMQKWVNDQIEEMDLATTLRRITVDAFYWMGICKVALGTPADAARFAWNLNAGEAFAEVVDPDNFVCSTGSADFSQLEYAGHRIRVPLDVVKSSKDYNKSRKKLEAMQDAAYNQDGDERISMIGRTWYGHQTTQFRDWVDLWEIYIPHERMILTLAADQIAGVSGINTDEALREQQWIGDGTGPYKFLGFGTAPGQLMPLAPIPNIMENHLFLNRTMRKMMRETDRVKNLLFVQGGADADGNRVMEADDGDIVRIDNPDKMVPASMGGADQRLVMMFELLRQEQNKLSGNVELVAGLDAGSKTATQDKMLNQNAGLTVSDMQGTTVEFTARVIKSLCWYWHHDPYKVMQTTWAAKGVPDISINRKVTPRDRMQVPWEDLDIKCDPYSLQHQTPQMRLQALDHTVMNIIIPMVPLMQQQGLGFDISAYLQMRAQYGDMPDLPDLVTIQEPPQTDTKSGAEQGGAPGPQDRTVTRENIPMRTQQGDAMNRRNQAMGVNPGGNAASAGGGGGGGGYGGGNGRRQLIA